MARIEHTADDVEHARLLAMIDHPHAAHAIAALTDDELDDVADAHEDEANAGEVAQGEDEFADPDDDADLYDGDGIEDMGH